VCVRAHSQGITWLHIVHRGEAGRCGGWGENGPKALAPGGSRGEAGRLMETG
jgi:hypothetical protein